jgi:hypothetical protein
VGSYFVGGVWLYLPEIELLIIINLTGGKAHLVEILDKAFGPFFRLTIAGSLWQPYSHNRTWFGRQLAQSDVNGDNEKRFVNQH